MAGLHLFPKAFAVIAGHNDEGFVQEPLRLERLEDGADIVVHIGDLAVVRTAGRSFPIGGRRVVGQVRVIVMDPGKEPVLSVLIQPAGEPGESIFGSPLGVGAFQGRLRLEGVVVDVEAPADAEARIDRKRGDEGGRGEAVTLQDLGQRFPLRHEVVAIVTHSVRRRIEAGHDRAVRRQGQRGRRIDAGETDALAGQTVQVGGQGLFEAVAAEVIGPGRIEGDEKEVMAGGGPRPEGSPSRADQQRRGHEAQRKGQGSEDRERAQRSARFRFSGRTYRGGLPRRSGASRLSHRYSRLREFPK